MAEGVGFGEKSAVIEAYFNSFIRLLNHFPVTIPPLPPHYPEGTLLGTPRGCFSVQQVMFDPLERMESRSSKSQYRWMYNLLDGGQFLSLRLVEVVLGLQPDQEFCGNLRILLEP